MMELHPLVAEFMDLVRIDAASGNERKVADALRQKLEALGFAVREDKAGESFGGNCGNLIAVLDGTLPGAILFTSHMDRVIGGYGVNPRIDGDRIVTDGSTVLAADDLSGAMAIIDGARRAKACGAALPRLEIVFSVGEEKCLLGGRFLDASALQAKVGYALDSPGRIGRIIKAAPSRAALCCEVYGKAAHAGNEPEKGINAVTVLGAILASVKEGRLDHETTANMALLETRNPNINVVQDYAKVDGEVRSLNNEKLEQYIAYFQKHCVQVAQERGASAQVTSSVEFPAFDLPDESWTVATAIKVFQEMGIEPSAERAGGGMDANHLNDKGIECVGLATGYFDNHTVQEHLVIEDFLRAGEMVERLILAYAQHPVL